MTPETWRLVTDLFHHALEHAPASRAAYLDQACAADHTLRAEVDRLLAAHKRAATLGTAPLANLTAPARARPDRIGTYDILDTLGEGGFGVVYRAQHAATGVQVALKTIANVHESVVASLRREIQALARVRHPGVVAIVDEGIYDGLPWYAMELLDGVTLRRWCATAPDRIARLAIVHRLCAPLAFLHGEGIVHGDLKPENVIVRTDGTPVLVDFGLASRFGGLSRDSLEIAQVGGTVLYMAPEQIRGHGIDARADLYALGCLLHELIAGRPPFTGESAAIMRDKLAIAPPPLSTYAPDASVALDELVARLLVANPAGRLGYAEDVASVLVALGAPAHVDAIAHRTYLYRPQLAGRARLVDELADRLDAGGRVLAVAGESGLGKTRIALELARRARDRGHTVLVGESQPHGGALHPLRHPLLHVADRCTARGREETDALLGPRGPILSLYVPALRSLPGQDQQPQPGVVPPREARHRACLAVADTLAALAQRTPVLLIVDDLQWADELTIEVLTLLAGERYRTVPLTVLATYRSEEISELLEPLVHDTALERFELARLPHDSVAHMVTGMLAVDEIPLAFSDYLYRHSEGNPFFVSEYLRLAVDEGVLVRTAGRWQLPHNDRELAVLPTPDSVRQLVRLRLAALSPEDLRLVSIAAVCGRAVELATLSAIAADRDDEAISQFITRALDRQVLVEHEGNELRFTHDKLREVTYELIARDERVRLHRAAADALVRATTTGVEARAAEIAAHYRLGNQPHDAVRYGRMAGHHALSTAALGDALHHFEQALASLAGLEPTPEVLTLEVELRLDQYSPRFQLYSAADPGLVELVRTAMPFARRLGDPALLAKLQDTLLVPLFARARYDELFAAAEPILAEANAAGDFRRIAAVSYLVAGSLLFRGEARRAIEVALPIIATLEQHDAIDELCGQSYPPYISLVCEVGLAHATLGDYSTGATWLARGEAAGARAGSRYGAAVSDMWWGFADAHDVATTVAHGERAVHLAREQKLAAPELFGLYSYGRGLALSGHAEAAVPLLADAIARSEAIGYVAFRSEGYRGLALAHLARGAFADLAATTTAALGFVATHGEQRLEAEFRRLRAEAELGGADGDLELAARELSAAIALATSQGATVYEARARATLGRLHVRLGDLAAARDELGRAATALADAGHTADAAAARAAIGR